MKKTSKTTKTPAPATKPTAPAPALKSTIAPKVKKPATVAALPAVVAKPTSPKITITAKVDVGFGNSLYVRGDGAGLNWNKGTLMDCVSSDTWKIVLTGAGKPLSFKFVMNDEIWSGGEDYVVSPGANATLTPAF